MSTLGHFTMATRRVGERLVVRLQFVCDQPLHTAVHDYAVSPEVGEGLDMQLRVAREQAFQWLAVQQHEVEVKRGIPVGYRVGVCFVCVDCAIPIHATTPATPATTMFAPSELPGGAPSSVLLCDGCARVVHVDIKRSRPTP